MAKIIAPFERKKTGHRKDMKEYTQKLLRHRLGIVGRIFVCALAAAGALLGTSRYFTNKSYDTFEVISSVEHVDTISTRYREYQESLLRYSKDGISCINLNQEPVWSQTYNMQEPVLEVCGPAAVVADQGGNQLYIFNESGLTGEVNTLLPIQQVAISRQGVTAVLLEDSSVSWIYLYDQAGNKLLDTRCNLGEIGQPLSLSLATDGSKLAVSYLQVAKGTASSCVVFYNLGAVGDNFVDKIVASRLYEGMLVPRVRYLTAEECVAIGENGFFIFEGAEIPEETEKGEFEGEIQSICFGGKRFGLVYTQAEGAAYVLRVFDKTGNAVLEQPFDLKYSQIKLSESCFIIYNDNECAIYSVKGVLRYQGEFTDSLVNLYHLKGQRYVVVHPQRTDQIKLS